MMKDIQTSGAGESGRPVILGEVLFDRFPDGTTVLGGAPFNVAWHLQGFGLDPLFISRVGADALGNQVREAMADWGMSLAGLQIDSHCPTGVVQVRLEGGQPHYTILPYQAYDFIEPVSALQAVANLDGRSLYHGSLIARHAVSQSTLQALRARGLPVFLDINLRAPWWNPASVFSLLDGARWLKLNDAELAIIQGGLLLDTEIAQAAEGLRRSHGLELLAVTLGADGALIVTAEETLRVASPAVEVVDTVGAGDAFSAVMLLGFWRGWPLPLTLRRAAEFAAAVCCQRGAIGSDRAFYAAHVTRWSDESA